MNTYRRGARAPLALLTLLSLLTACPSEKPAGTSAETTKAVGTDTPAGAALVGENLTPDPGGRVIVVEVETDDQGVNRFEPAEITAKRGDVIRFHLETGVHNVNFVPDSNSSKVGLPAKPSDMLQLPGQTYDVKVSMEPGSHYFHCDPHALLGMKGKLTIK